jgi:hypothetical protein
VLEHDGQCVAALSWHQPQRDAIEDRDRHIECHAHAAQRSPHDNTLAMKFDIAHVSVGGRIAGTGKPEGSRGPVAVRLSP